MPICCIGRVEVCNIVGHFIRQLHIMVDCCSQQRTVDTIKGLSHIFMIEFSLRAMYINFIGANVL